VALKEPVALAVDELRKAFTASQVTVREDGQGGAYVIVESVPLRGFRQAASWIGFRITFQYPYADCYPHFVASVLLRADGSSPLRTGITAGHTFEGRAALQLSRRSNRLNPQTDTAFLKLKKVVRWLEGN
jgi:hypothetical protein